MSTRRKLLLLGALYLAQGLPYGFFTQALPVVLREMGVSLGNIGLSSLLALPWVLKFLWAPVVDRTSTRRRWLLTLQATSVILAVLLALADPEGPGGIKVMLVAVLLTNLVAATQDIATDGLAVTMLSREERGLGNGIQVGGYRVGMILGGGLLLVLFDKAGWTPTMIGLAVLLALASLPLLAERNLPEPVPEPPSGANPWSWVQRDGALAWICVLVAFKAGDYLAGGMLRPYLVDLGLSKTDIGVILGTGGFVSGLLGAVIGGALLSRTGRVRGLVVFGLLQASGVAAYAAVVTTGVTGAGLWGAVIYEHFVGGLATAALFTSMMDASRRSRAGTDYTVQASVVVLASGAAAAMSGYVAESIGYAQLFVLGAALALLGPALAAIPRLTRVTRTPEDT